jgi:hypothetical protein
MKKGVYMHRIYLSGPMTGIPDFNFPAFHAEAKRLRALGYEVVNPAEITPDHETPRWICLRRDIAALMECDTLALLDGWESSEGARLEEHIARHVAIRIVLAGSIQQRNTTKLRFP